MPQGGIKLTIYHSILVFFVWLRHIHEECVAIARKFMQN